MSFSWGKWTFPFRATKDLDIVLMSEMLDTAFATDFWRFVRHGQYQVAESTGGTPRFYRFSGPQDESFPSMIELFFTRPERLPPASGQTLTPIPFDDPVSSLSAILLDETYYAFLKGGVRRVEGISVVGPEHLVPLKARAGWTSGSARRRGGKPTPRTSSSTSGTSSGSTRYGPAPRKDIIPVVSADMQRFLVEARSETISLKSLGITNTSLDEVLAQLGRIYGAE